MVGSSASASTNTLVWASRIMVVFESLHPFEVRRAVYFAGSRCDHFAAVAGKIRPAGLSGKGVSSPRVPVAINSDAASRIAIVSAAVTSATGVFIVTRSRC